MNNDTNTPLPDLAAMIEKGRNLDTLRFVPCEERPNLDFGGLLTALSIVRLPTEYTISAKLPNILESCPFEDCTNHLGHNCDKSTVRPLMKRGHIVVRFADLPYMDKNGNPTPVFYAIRTQRYQCPVCMRGSIDPIPKDFITPITTSRITSRLAFWLLYVLQTKTPNNVIARMTDYSTVWVRKWYKDVRDLYDLQPKIYRPGRKPKGTSTKIAISTEG